jgi:hypothetical protein
VTARASYLYVYCIGGPGIAEAAAGLGGVEDGRAPFVVAAGDLVAVASEVPAEGYAEAALKERLHDLGWAAEKGLRHERVVETCTLAGPTIPLRFCTIFESSERVAALLERHAERLRAILADLAGKAEWGLRAYLDRPRFDAALEAEAREAAATPGATGGRAYLERKKAAMDARARADRALAEALAATFSAHQEAAARAAIQPVAPGTQPAGDLVLKAALLVPQSERERLERVFAAERARLEPRGIALKLSGPWPPYAFVPPLEESAGAAPAEAHA